MVLRPSSSSLMVVKSLVEVIDGGRIAANIQDNIKFRRGSAASACSCNCLINKRSALAACCLPAAVVGPCEVFEVGFTLVGLDRNIARIELLNIEININVA